VEAAEEIGFPVALKIFSPDITHKSEVGGVELELESAEDVRKGARRMRERVEQRRPDAEISGFTVQRMLRRPHAFELIAGITVDQQFGPVLLFGQGGTAVEVIRDQADHVIANPPDTSEPPKYPEDVTRNHSAALYSLLVVNHYVPVSTLVSPADVNPWVRVKEDYDFDAYNPSRDSYWDSTFRMRIDREDPGAHGSYAHRAIHGPRKSKEWRPDGEPEQAVLVNRGPRDGVSAGEAYHDSPTLRFHPPDRAWVGHIVRHDNHVETVTIPPTDRVTTAGEPVRVRNPFLDEPREGEEAHESTGGKRVVMSVYRAMAPEGGLRVYDPLTFSRNGVETESPATQPDEEAGGG